MSSLEPRNFTTTDSEYCNIANTQEKDLKIPFVTITEILKYEMNKSPKEVQENTNGRRK